MYYSRKVLMPSIFTDQQEQQENLSLQSQLWKLVPVGLAIVNEDAIIVKVTKRLGDIFHYQWPNDLIGQPISTLVHPEARPMHDKVFKHWFNAPNERAMGGKLGALKGITFDNQEIDLFISLNYMYFDEDTGFPIRYNDSPVEKIAIAFVFDPNMFKM